MRVLEACNNSVIAIIPVEQVDLYNKVRSSNGNPYKWVKVFLFMTDSIIKNPDYLPDSLVFHGSYGEYLKLKNENLITIDNGLLTPSWDEYVPMSQRGFGPEGQKLDKDYLKYRPSTMDLINLLRV